MFHKRLHKLICLLFCMSTGTTEGSAGPGEAAARSGSRPAGGRADFKVVVWYRRNDSLGTFKYEIYDVRKGEYTAKVDEWVEGRAGQVPRLLCRGARRRPDA